jgi:hypothetical protein
MRISKRIVLTVVVALVVLSAFALVQCQRAIGIDSCLDMGGRWNYETNSCEGARS